MSLNQALSSILLPGKTPAPVPGQSRNVGGPPWRIPGGRSGATGATLEGRWPQRPFRYDLPDSVTVSQRTELCRRGERGQEGGDYHGE